MVDLLNHSTMFSIDGGGLCNDNFLHASLDGFEGIIQFGDHPPNHGTVGYIAFEVIKMDDGNHAFFIVGIAEYSFLLKRKDEGDIKEGGQGLSRLSCNGICIGV